MANESNLKKEKRTFMSYGWEILTIACLAAL